MYRTRFVFAVSQSRDSACLKNVKLQHVCRGAFRFSGVLQAQGGLPMLIPGRLCRIAAQPVPVATSGTFVEEPSRSLTLTPSQRHMLFKTPVDVARQRQANEPRSRHRDDGGQERSVSGRHWAIGICHSIPPILRRPASASENRHGAVGPSPCATESRALGQQFRLDRFELGSSPAGKRLPTARRPPASRPMNALARCHLWSARVM